MNNFPILRRLRGQNVNLILPLNQYLKGSNKLKGFAIDLQGDNLTPTLGLQLHTLPLPQPKRLLHSNLHLPHMQHIAKPNDLLYNLRRIDLFYRSSPSQGPRKIIPRSKRQYRCRRIMILPFGYRLHIIHDTTYGSISPSDKQEQIGHIHKQLQLYIHRSLLSNPSSRIEITCKGFNMR